MTFRVVALRVVALGRGLDRDFRFDLPERHTYTPETLPSEPNYFSSTITGKRERHPPFKGGRDEAPASIA
jgi:hypothetical protein